MNIVIVRVTFRLVLSFRDNARNSIYEKILQYLFRLVQTLSLLAQKAGFVRSGKTATEQRSFAPQARSRHVISVSRFPKQKKTDAEIARLLPEARVFTRMAKARRLNGDGLSTWRRRRDLNPRYGFPYYSLSRGAP